MDASQVGECFDEDFINALNDLDSSSTVGCCALKRYGPTVRDALGGVCENGICTYNPERVAILKALVSRRLSEVAEADPIRVFVKREPHKISKLKEGRYRLISAVSLVDTMCDRIMFGRLVVRMLSMVGQTPCMIGWSPMGGGARLLSRIFGERMTRALDMLAWDWTVPGWLLLAIKEVIRNLHVNRTADFDAWLDARWEALFRDAVFRFGNGLEVTQPGWGFMKSGCYLTILINSLAQIFVHELACIKFSLPKLPYVVLGDDKTIVDFEEFHIYEAFINSLGLRLKPSEPSRLLKFAGFVFEGDLSWPEYVGKHIYQITHAAGDLLLERLEAYHFLYVNHDLFSFFSRELGKRDPERVRPYGELLGIYHGTHSRATCPGLVR